MLSVSENIKVFVAADHGGVLLKDFLKNQKINDIEIEFIDLGTEGDSSVDYPDYAQKVCLELKNNPKAMGLLICGSGQGMAMSANKFQHIRAALCWNEEIALLAKSHNNANVLCLGARVISEDLALKIWTTFLSTPYEGGRHESRLLKMKEIVHD